MRSITASRTNDISIVLIWQSSFESLTRRRSGASQKALECYTKETSVVLGSDVKSNCIPPVTYLHRSTNSKQRCSINARRLSFPCWSHFLIRKISQKCSRDDRKMMLGGLHGRGLVHTSGVGAPMVPRGHVIHHQQTCAA